MAITNTVTLHTGRAQAEAGMDLDHVLACMALCTCVRLWMTGQEQQLPSRPPLGALHPAADHFMTRVMCRAGAGWCRTLSKGGRTVADMH